MTTNDALGLVRALQQVLDSLNADAATFIVMTEREYTPATTQANVSNNAMVSEW